MKTYNDVFSGNGTALIPFFVIGDPDFDRSLETVRTAVEAGVDVLELGIPFSDPIADGPTIQRADVRALDNGMTCERAFELIEKIRSFADVPIGLLMYYNLITHYGAEAFYKDAAAAGVNSVLVADLCVDDAEELSPYIEANHLDSVYMVTPNTTDARQDKIARLCTGFIYTVSLLGVTGARGELSDLVAPLVRSLKAKTEAPVCVGFGVSKPEHAKQLKDAGADGVIVGSALVDIIEKNLSHPDSGKGELAACIQAMKKAIAG